MTIKLEANKSLRIVTRQGVIHIDTRDDKFFGSILPAVGFHAWRGIETLATDESACTFHISPSQE